MRTNFVRASEGARSLTSILAAFMLLSLAFVPQVFAHAPLMPGNNDSLATAAVVSDPTKSWAVYAELSQGVEAQYYRFDIAEGQRIHVSLLKSTAPDNQGFLPSFVLMGPKLGMQAVVPNFVQMPQGADSIVVHGKDTTQGTYEPFSPSAFYELANLQLDAPTSGTYYVAVYGNSRGGHYGLAIGDRESFTLTEWILTPLSVISIRQWSDQSPLLTFAPLAMTLVVGLVVLIMRRRTTETPRTPLQWTTAITGLLFLASGFTMITQMLLALTFAPAELDLIVTIVLALIPIIMGILAVRFAVRKTATTKTRVTMVVLGVLGLFAWAGFIAGPVFAVMSSVLPD